MQALVTKGRPGLAMPGPSRQGTHAKALHLVLTLRSSSLPRLCCPGVARGTLRCMASAAAAAPVPTPLATVMLQYPAVAPLPPPPSSSSLAQVVPYLAKLALAERSQLWRVVCALLAMVVSKMAGLAIPMLFKSAVDALAGGTGEAAMQAAMKAVLCYGAMDALKAVSRELQAPIFTPVTQAVTRRVAYHTFSHVLDLDIKFHLDRRTGRVSRILERGTRSIAILYRALIFTFLPTSFELVAVCGLLAAQFGTGLAAIVGATFLTYTAWSLTMTQVATDVRKEVNNLDNATTAKAVDALLNYETVTLFNNQRLEVGQYDQLLRGFQAASVRTERLSATLNVGQALILAVGMTGVMYATVASRAATGGDLVLAYGLITQLWAPLMFLGWFYRELRAALVDMEEFFQILQTTPNIKDGTQQLPSIPLSSPPRVSTNNGSSSNGNGFNGNGRHPAEAVSHHHALAGRPAGGFDSAGEAGPSGRGLSVELEDVRFGYMKDRQILKGVSLRIAPGESVAVVGPSGSGKSTILKLVTRLYDVDEGSVRVNGLDVRDIQQASLRSAVAVVPQDTALNYDSVLENIRYGRPDATDDEVIAAAKMASLHDTVMKMSDGYKTMVGERGLKLSGGEKQRVAIARAFLRRPRLLVCDEATSALDSATEAAIMASLAQLAQGRSALFVAHRLSTVRCCDRIVVLRDGHVAEEGSHDQLMARRGVYAAMWELQASEEAQAQRSGPGRQAEVMGLDGGATDSEEEAVVPAEVLLLPVQPVVQRDEAVAVLGSGTSTAVHGTSTSSAGAATAVVAR